MPEPTVPTPTPDTDPENLPPDRNDAPKAKKDADPKTSSLKSGHSAKKK